MCIHDIFYVMILQLGDLVSSRIDELFLFIETHYIYVYLIHIYISYTYIYICI